MRRRFIGTFEFAIAICLCAGCAHRSVVSPPQGIPSTPWRVANLPSHATDITRVGQKVWVCGADDLIAESTGGETWQVKHWKKNGSILTLIAFSNDRFGFAAGTDGTLLLSQDGGTKWVRVPGVQGNVYNASFSDAHDGIIETAKGLEYTHDGGTSWKDVSYRRSADEMRQFRFVRSLVALDSNRMGVLLKEGSATYYDQRIMVTNDGGGSWEIQNPEHTVLGTLIDRNGEYWALGVEVVDRQNHGGHAISLVMHSPDAENWSKQVRPQKEIQNCTSSGCLLWNGAGVDPFGGEPSYWTFPPEKPPTAKWAATNSVICTVSETVQCAQVSLSPTVPSYVYNEPIPSVTGLPRLPID